MNFFRRSHKEEHQPDSPVILRENSKGYWFRCEDRWRPPLPNIETRRGNGRIPMSARR